MTDLTDFLETHYEVATFLNQCLEHEENKVFTHIFQKEGRGGVWQLAKKLTEEFHEKYKNEIWGENLDWLDTLELFLTEKIESI